MKTLSFLIALSIVLALCLLLTVSELQRCKRVIEEAQAHVDTIYRGTEEAKQFCLTQIEEAKCKSL